MKYDSKKVPKVDLLKHTMSHFKINIKAELLIWISALVALALMNPDKNDMISLCVFHHLGINFCPGCGLGHSISYFLHGQIQQSFQAHPFGIFAVLVLIGRILKLTFTKNNHINKFYTNAIWKHL